MTRSFRCPPMAHALVLLVLPALCVSLAYGGGCTKAPSPEATSVKVLKMASVNAFSGKAASWGFSEDRGMRLAAEKVNEAGGIRIGTQTYIWEIRSYDNRYVPAESVSCFKRAIADGCTFMCELGGACMQPLIPLVNQHKVITLAAIAGGSDFTNPSNPYLFRTMPSADLLFGIEGLKVYTKLGVKRIALVTQDTELGRSDGKILKRVLKAAGMDDRLVAEEYVPMDTTDFTPVLTRVLAKGVDHIEGGAWPAASLGLLVRQARELGFKGTITNMTGAPEVAPLVEAAGKENAEGLILCRLWPPDQLPTEEFKKFWDDYRARFGEDPGANAWEGHAAFQFLSGAIAKAQTLDPDKIVEVMRNHRQLTLLGEVVLIGKDNPMLPGYGVNNQFSAPMPITRIENGRPVLFDVR